MAEEEHSGEKLRVLVIASDDGRIYKIDEDQLQAYQMDSSTRDYESARLFAEMGVFHMRLKKVSAVPGEPESKPHHQYGIFVWIAAHAVHFVNLAVSHENDQDDEEEDQESGDTEQESEDEEQESEQDD